MTDTVSQPEIREVNRIVVRFAGDSGDGMQLTHRVKVGGKMLRVSANYL